MRRFWKCLDCKRHYDIDVDKCIECRSDNWKEIDINTYIYALQKIVLNLQMIQRSNKKNDDA